MVAEISGAGVGHSVQSQTGTAVLSRVIDTILPEESGRMTSEPLFRGKLESSTALMIGVFSQLRSRQEALNQVASTVREVTNTTEKANQLLSGMEEDLTTVVKMFPPYPVENPERISLLNSFGGLRRQIEALTYPPPEELKLVGRVLGEGVINEESVVGKLENSLMNVFTNQQGWNIPTLNADTASDDDVGNVLDQVKSMKSFLDEMQASMWADVVSFVNQAETPEAKSEGAEVREFLAGLDGDRGIIGRNALQLEAVAES